MPPIRFNPGDMVVRKTPIHPIFRILFSPGKPVTVSNHILNPAVLFYLDATASQDHGGLLVLEGMRGLEWFGNQFELVAPNQG